MIKFVLLAATAGLLTGVSAVPAAAQIAPQSPEIGGDVTIDDYPNASLGPAIGPSAVARASACTIVEGVKIKGDVALKCKATFAGALVIGPLSRATAHFDGVGAPKK